MAGFGWRALCYYHDAAVGRSGNHSDSHTLRTVTTSLCQPQRTLTTIPSRREPRAQRGLNPHPRVPQPGTGHQDLKSTYTAVPWIGTLFHQAPKATQTPSVQKCSSYQGGGMGGREQQRISRDRGKNYCSWWSNGGVQGHSQLYGKL